MRLHWAWVCLFSYGVRIGTIHLETDWISGRLNARLNATLNATEQGWLCIFRFSEEQLVLHSTYAFKPKKKEHYIHRISHGCEPAGCSSKIGKANLKRKRLWSLIYSSLTPPRKFFSAFSIDALSLLIWPWPIFMKPAAALKGRWRSPVAGFPNT